MLIRKDKHILHFSVNYIHTVKEFDLKTLKNGFTNYLLQYSVKKRFILFAKYLNKLQKCSFCTLVSWSTARIKLAVGFNQLYNPEPDCHTNSYAIKNKYRQKIIYGIVFKIECHTHIKIAGFYS